MMREPAVAVGAPDSRTSGHRDWSGSRTTLRVLGGLIWGLMATTSMPECPCRIRNGINIHGANRSLDFLFNDNLKTKTDKKITRSKSSIVR